MESLVQIGPTSFLDEGVDRVIKVTRDDARLSGLLLAVYSWSEATAGRSYRPSVEGRVKGPDYEFAGGLYIPPDPRYYSDTRIKVAQLRTQDAPFKDVDILEQVLKPCQAAGLKVYAALWLLGEPDYADKLDPVLHAGTEVDAWGQPVDKVFPHKWLVRPIIRHCFNNPDYRGFHRGLVENLLRNYPLDGLMIAPHERYGPVETVLISGTVPTCFCPNCVAKGKARGIDADAAARGLQQLHEFAKQARSEAYQRPLDGHFTSLLRLLLANPEVLAWEKLWYESAEEYVKDLYSMAKQTRPEAQVGLHVWQGASWALFHRAEVSYERLAECADWIKPVLYDSPAGIRFVTTYARPCHQTMLRDLDFEEVVRLLLRITGQEPAANSEALARIGFGPSYIERETARAVAAVQGKASIYPGLGIDVEPPPNSGLEYPEQSAEDIEAGVRAARRGGAEGVALSVNYSQMRDSSLRAVGRALSS
ncbi:MAG: hypothetical protein HYX92_07950 [Chloroflexi bacterium]|nr:hypothetical protein [Chloroflexota bacterium]